MTACLLLQCVKGTCAPPLTTSCCWKQGGHMWHPLLVLSMPVHPPEMLICRGRQRRRYSVAFNTMVTVTDIFTASVSPFSHDLPPPTLSAFVRVHPFYFCGTFSLFISYLHQSRVRHHPSLQSLNAIFMVPLIQARGMQETHRRIWKSFSFLPL